MSFHHAPLELSNKEYIEDQEREEQQLAVENALAELRLATNNTARVLQRVIKDIDGSPSEPASKLRARVVRAANQNKAVQNAYVRLIENLPEQHRLGDDVEEVTCDLCGGEGCIVRPGPIKQRQLCPRCKGKQTVLRPRRIVDPENWTTG